jgi:G6PDH family F420-dependent oxidoreductase
MLDGRFELGVGSGEQLNEHILGSAWPPTDVRLDMLEEAVDVIRQLWSGDEVSHHGTHYTVEDARIYTLPAGPPPILVSGFGPKSTDLAARIGDGYATTSPSADLVSRYRDAGGTGPVSGALKFCWGPDRDECVQMAHRLWRTSGVPGELSQELRTPALFEQASQLVTPQSMAENMPCGPDPQSIIDAVNAYVEARFDRLYLTQIGPHQKAFFEFFAAELSPALADLR